METPFHCGVNKAYSGNLVWVRSLRKIESLKTYFSELLRLSEVAQSALIIMGVFGGYINLWLMFCC